MADVAADRTEPATPKRLEEARNKGQVPFSRDVSGTLVLAVAFLLALSPLAAALATSVVEQSRALWGGYEVHPRTLADFHALLLAHLGRTAAAGAPLLGLILLAGLLGSLVQVGPLFSTEAVAFKLDKIDPVKGLKRLVSPERAMELLKNLVKLVLVLGVSWLVLAPALSRILGLYLANVREALVAMGVLSRTLVAQLLIVLIALAALDLLWVRWRHQQRLKMTKQEVRDELRQREGDPEIRQRMRSQRHLSHQRMLAEVAKSDVVVRNPDHYAVALRYERQAMASPQVIAKGRNQVALRILEAARRHGVPVVENAPLARLLYRTTRVGREIPEALYEAVAEVLAYVYRVDRRRAGAWGVSS